MVNPRILVILLIPVSTGWLDGEKIAMAACGDEHTVVLTFGAHVYTWGDGSDAQLGQGSYVSLVAPAIVHVLGGQNADELPGDSLASGLYDLKPLQNASFVAAGARHSLVVTSRGNVWTW